MTQTVKPVPDEPRRRGRPRDPQIRAAILRAARALLDELGPAALTMEAVAQRAGVGKPTVYRWWPNRHAVAMAALMDEADGPEGAGGPGEPGRLGPARTSGSARPGPVRSGPLSATPALQRLEQQLLDVAHTLATRSGRHVTAIIAAADPDSEIARAFRHQFVLARRNEGRAWLQQAVQQGELRAELQLEVALDQIYGALFFRLLLGHAPVDAAFVRALLAQAVVGFAPRTSPRSGPPRVSRP